MSSRWARRCAGWPWPDNNSSEGQSSIASRPASAGGRTQRVEWGCWGWSPVHQPLEGAQSRWDLPRAARPVRSQPSRPPPRCSRSPLRDGAAGAGGGQRPTWLSCRAGRGAGRERRPLPAPLLTSGTARTRRAGLSGG